MNWENWQSYAAPIIVLVTVAMFAKSFFKSKKKKNCGGDCGCSVSKKVK